MATPHIDDEIAQCPVSTFIRIVNQITENMPKKDGAEKADMRQWRMKATKFVKESIGKRGGSKQAVALYTQLDGKELLIFDREEYDELHGLFEKILGQVGTGKRYKKPSELPWIVEDINVSILLPTFEPKLTYSRIMPITWLYAVRHLILSTEGGTRSKTARMKLYVQMRKDNEKARSLCDGLEHATLAEWDAYAELPDASRALSGHVGLSLELESLINALSDGTSTWATLETILEANRTAAQYYDPNDPNTVHGASLPTPFLPRLARSLINHPLPERPETESEPANRKRQLSGSPRESPPARKRVEHSLAYFISDRKRILYGFGV